MTPFVFPLCRGGFPFPFPAGELWSGAFDADGNQVGSTGNTEINGNKPLCGNNTVRPMGMSYTDLFKLYWRSAILKADCNCTFTAQFTSTTEAGTTTVPFSDSVVIDFPLIAATVFNTATVYTGLDPDTGDAIYQVNTSMASMNRLSGSMTEAGLVLSGARYTTFNGLFGRFASLPFPVNSVATGAYPSLYPDGAPAAEGVLTSPGNGSSTNENWEHAVALFTDNGIFGGARVAPVVKAGDLYYPLLILRNGNPFNGDWDGFYLASTRWRANPANRYALNPVEIPNGLTYGDYSCSLWGADRGAANPFQFGSYSDTAWAGTCALTLAKSWTYGGRYDATTGLYTL